MSYQYSIKNLGVVDFETTYQQMKEFTLSRDKETVDEFWSLQHKGVFTLGLSGKEEHLLCNPNNIPVVRCDRGGQITYHGPGQIVIYPLVDLARIGLNIRDFVSKLELGVVNFLSQKYGISSYANKDAPGVYVEGKKIASLGLKIKNHRVYHGLSFNANMDLSPFDNINVCGYNNLSVTQLSWLCNLSDSLDTVSMDLLNYMIHSIYDIKSSPHG